MRENKFEEAFCVSEKRIRTVDELEIVFHTDKTRFATQYRDFLVCPECRKASLQFVNAATAHLRTKKGDEHEEECSLQQGAMTPQQVKHFIEDDANREEIQRQMDRLLLMMVSGEPVSTGSAKKRTPTTYVTPATKIVSSGFFRDKRLPRKRVDLPFADDDFGCKKLFYGTVDFTWEEKRDSESNAIEYYKILLFHPVKKKLLCKIKITRPVYERMKADYKRPNQFRCVVVFLAEFEPNVGKTYQVTSLRFANYLKIIKS